MGLVGVGRGFASGTISLVTNTVDGLCNCAAAVSSPVGCYVATLALGTTHTAGVQAAAPNAPPTPRRGCLRARGAGSATERRRLRWGGCDAPPATHAPAAPFTPFHPTPTLSSSLAAHPYPFKLLGCSALGQLNQRWSQAGQRDLGARHAAQFNNLGNVGGCSASVPCQMRWRWQPRCTWLHHYCVSRGCAILCRSCNVIRVPTNGHQ